VLATITGLNYTDRPAQTSVTSATLVDKLTTDEVMATYVKNVGPTLALNLQFGVLGVVNNYFDLSIPHTILPQYGFSAQWSATPKLNFNAAVSRMASVPTTLIANLQITESASLGFAYHYTPKLTLTGNVQASYSNSEVNVQGTETVLNGYTTNQKTYTAGAGLAYALTPFVTANLSYQFYRSIQANLTTNSSLIMLALNFNPL
jgi:opacity protein-like surface antigen